MPSNAIRTAGATLEIENPSTSQYDQLFDVRSVSGPDQSTNVIEVTPLESTTREYINGLTDPGNLGVEMNYTSTAYDTLCDLQESGSPRLVKFTFSDGSNVVCSGIVDNVSVNSDSDGVHSMSANFKLSGTNTRASS
jgi:hypothetical protein